MERMNSFQSISKTTFSISTSSRVTVMAEQCARKSKENSESRCSTNWNQLGNHGQMSKWETKKMRNP